MSMLMAPRRYRTAFASSSHFSPNGGGAESHSSSSNCALTLSWRLATHICSRVTLISVPSGAAGPPGASGSTVASCSRNMRRSGMTGISSRSNLRLKRAPLHALALTSMLRQPGSEPGFGDKARNVIHQNTSAGAVPGRSADPGAHLGPEPGVTAGRLAARRERGDRGAPDGHLLDQRQGWYRGGRDVFPLGRQLLGDLLVQPLAPIDHRAEREYLGLVPIQAVDEFGELVEGAHRQRGGDDRR